MATLTQIQDQTGVRMLTSGHIDPSLDIPVDAGPHRQGDVAILPLGLGGTVPAAIPARLDPRKVTGAGVTVVSGDHDHILTAFGTVLWYPTPGAGPKELGEDVGFVQVEPGAEAYLHHSDEHGPHGIAPGRYLIRRQVEQAETQRLVAD